MCAGRKQTRQVPATGGGPEAFAGCRLIISAMNPTAKTPAATRAARGTARRAGHPDQHEPEATEKACGSGDDEGFHRAPPCRLLLLLLRRERGPDVLLRDPELLRDREDVALALQRGELGLLLQGLALEAARLLQDGRQLVAREFDRRRGRSRALPEGLFDHAGILEEGAVAPAPLPTPSSASGT